MSFTSAWDPTKPSGGRDVNLGDDDIREFKVQVQERSDVDGYFPAADDAKTGYHRKTTLLEQASDPAQVADSLILYTKLVGSYSELFSRHESAALQQLTLNGKLWIPALSIASIAQGDLLYFDGTIMNRLAAGTSGQYLKTLGAGANPAWAAVSGSYQNGLARNLKVTNSGSSHVITLTADEALVDDGAGTVQRFTSLSLTADIEAALGAGGLDTGSENPTTWYYVWLIAKADGTKNLLLSASASAPTLPSGYTYKALMSAVRNNGSSNFISFTQTGRNYRYTVWQTLASGNVGTGSWTSIDTTAFVPSALSNNAMGQISAISSSAAIANDNSVASSYLTAAPNRVYANGAVNIYSYFNIEILTANTLYWGSGGGSDIIYLQGFDINKLAA